MQYSGTPQLLLLVLEQLPGPFNLLRRRKGQPPLACQKVSIPISPISPLLYSPPHSSYSHWSGWTPFIKHSLGHRCTWTPRFDERSHIRATTTPQPDGPVFKLPGMCYAITSYSPSPLCFSQLLLLVSSRPSKLYDTGTVSLVVSCAYSSHIAHKWNGEQHHFRKGNTDLLLHSRPPFIVLFVNICSIGSWPNIWIVDLISARSNHPRHFDVCLVLSSSLPSIAPFTVLNLFFYQYFLGNSTSGAVFILVANIHTSNKSLASSPRYDAAPSASSLPHSYLSFHSSVSQPRQGAPLIKLVGMLPYPIPILIPPLTFC